MRRSFFLLILSLLVSTSRGAEKAVLHGPHTLPRAVSAAGSIYDLESEWFDQEGKKMPLEALAGKVRIVAMGYTSCKFACPRIIADLQRIEAVLTRKGIGAERVSLSFVSIDPDVDTPQVMKNLERDYRMDPKRWLLLTGNDDGVLELAVALGMKYRKTSAMDFAHSNIISVLSSGGTIVHQTDSIGAELSGIVGIIENTLD